MSNGTQQPACQQSGGKCFNKKLKDFFWSESLKSRITRSVEVVLIGGAIGYVPWLTSDALSPDYPWYRVYLIILGIFLLFAHIVYSVKKDVPECATGVRMFCLIAFICITGFVALKRHQAALSHSTWQPPELPIGCEMVWITFGGMSNGESVHNLHSNAGFQFGTNQPFHAKIRDNRLYVDAAIEINSHPPIKITISNGRVSSIPQSCDRNYNSNAFEIVDELNKPILQLIYKTPEHVIINGLFDIGGVETIAFGGQTRPLNPNLNPAPFSIPFPERIAYFKYPSSKFQGVVAEK